MTEEAEKIRTALGAMNRALARFGSPPIADNPMFSMESVPGCLIYAMKTPPLRFEFGFEFQVGLGSVSEVCTPALDDSSGLAGG